MLERFSRLRAHVQFLPPSREGTIVFPGFDGGAEWGGAAADPGGILYVNANEMPWVLNMIDSSGATSLGQQVYLQNCTGCHGAERRGNAAGNIPSLVDIQRRLSRDQIMEVITKGRAVMPSWGFLSEAQRGAVVSYLMGETEKKETSEQGAWQTYLPDSGVQAFTPPPYTHTGYNRFLDPDGYPAVKPPWGTLNAIDLNTGEYLWRVPLGEYPELMAKGLPPTGAENYGGPLVTAGGVLFIGASKDENFRAFDMKTGRELWRAKLPAGGYASPATYEVAGRQYVVIACGGGKIGTKSGDAYVAYALPVKWPAAPARGHSAGRRSGPSKRTRASRLLIVGPPPTSPDRSQCGIRIEEKEPPGVSGLGRCLPEERPAAIPEAMRSHPDSSGDFPLPFQLGGEIRSSRDPRPPGHA